MAVETIGKRLLQAIKELNDLTHVDISDYTEEEYEYRGELLSDLYAEFQRAGYKTVYDIQARSWELQKVDE